MAKKTSRPSLKKGVDGWLERTAHRVTVWAGGNWAFATAFAIVVVWAALGPVFHYADTWQLVINTGTTIVTFLMVFLIQRSQNKDSRAVHLKLNELVAALDGASNRLIDAEDLSEAELEALHRYYQALVRMSRQDRELTLSHSVEEAESRHEEKLTKVQSRPRSSKASSSSPSASSSASSSSASSSAAKHPPKTGRRS